MTCRVNQGKPRTIYLIIYADEQSEAAPLGMNGNVHELCTVEADLRQIPESQIMQVIGSDGFMYYYIEAQIEALCKLKPSTWDACLLRVGIICNRSTDMPIDGSASVAYTLIYNGMHITAGVGNGNVLLTTF